MSEFQGTPGPWEVFSNPIGIGVTPSDESESDICRCDSKHIQRPTEETIANAHAIAALPDLLALAYQYRNDLLYPMSEDSRERRIAVIHAALAKATGA